MNNENDGDWTHWENALDALLKSLATLQQKSAELSHAVATQAENLSSICERLRRLEARPAPDLNAIVEDIADLRREQNETQSAADTLFQTLRKLSPSGQRS